jgi:predicted SnoaL-like aldol condensation-catalyzing enzyme
MKKGPQDHAGDASRDVLLRMIEMFETGVTADVSEVVSDSYHDHQGLKGTIIHGTEGFSKVVGAARSSFVRLEIEVEDVVAEGDRAVGRIRWHGELPGGELVERETIDIVRVVNDRAVEHWGAETWSRRRSPSDR